MLESFLMIALSRKDMLFAWVTTNYAPEPMFNVFKQNKAVTRQYLMRTQHNDWDPEACAMGGPC